MLDSNNTSKRDNSQMPTLQPMDFGGILDSALSLYRNNFRVFLAIIAIYIVWIGLQEAVVVWLLDRYSILNLDQLWLLERYNTPNFNSVISDVDDLLDNLVYMFCLGIVVVASSDIYLGRPVTFQTALQQFCSRFLTYLGSSFLFLIPWTILTLDSVRILTLRSSLLPLSILFFLCVFYIRWIFYGPVVCLEGFTISQVFGRSRSLVRGNWIRVFRITFAILFLEIGVYYILGNSLGIVFALLGIVQDGSLMETIGDMLSLKYENMRPTSLDSVIMYIVYLGVEAFALPIHGIGITLLYYDLRIRKEGFDIEMRVRNAEALDVVNEV